MQEARLYTCIRAEGYSRAGGIFLAAIPAPPNIMESITEAGT